MNSNPSHARVQDPTIPRCARCGAGFSCGAVAGTTHCWCAELPVLRSLDPVLPGCLCPACLRQSIALQRQDLP